MCLAYKYQFIEKCKCSVSAILFSVTVQQIVFSKFQLCEAEREKNYGNVKINYNDIIYGY